MSKGAMWIGLCAVIGLIILLAGLSPAQPQNTNGNTNSNANSRHKSKNSNSNMAGDMSGTNSNAGGTTGGLSASDRKFVMNAAMGGMAEVSLGQLAVQKASSADVRQFGQRMVDDHTKANDNLKQVAAQKGLTLPTALDAKHQADMDKLSKLSGDAFDRAYMKDMVKDHQQDTKEFQNEANKGQDADIKSFASTTLPVLQEHLSMAQSTNAALNTSAKNASNMNRPSSMDSNMAGNSNSGSKHNKHSNSNSNTGTGANANNSNR